MRILMTMGFLTLLAFTHPFAREGGVETQDDVMEERVQKAKENERALENAKEAVQREEAPKDSRRPEVERSDRETAEELVD